MHLKAHNNYIRMIVKLLKNYEHLNIILLHKIKIYHEILRKEDIHSWRYLVFSASVIMLAL